MSLRAAATTLTGVSASGSRRREGRSCASGTRSRWPAGPTTSASSPSIAAIVPCTPSAGASTGSPAASGAVSGSGSSSDSDRALRPHGSLRGRAEPAVALRLVPPLAARHPDLVSQRLELRACGRELAQRLGGSALALGCGGRPHRVDLGLELLLALPRAFGEPCRLGVLAPPPAARSAAAPRSAASASASSSWIRSRSGATRPRASATTAASRPSRSAIWSACEIPGRPSAMPVQRRVRVGVEPRGRVRDAVRRARPLLQLGVVRRHDRQARLLGEPRQECLRQRGALDRVRAGGHLVEQDERPLPGRAQDLDEVGDVAGEGREAHLDRLPVADVREHLVEDRQRGRVRRRAQPGLVQQRGEAERLQGDGLAAGVRAADHERAQAAEVEVDRHGGLGVEQRMARADQPHLVRDLDGRAAPAARDGAERDREVDLPGRLDGERERVCLLGRRPPTARAGSARPPRARRPPLPTGGC